MSETETVGKSHIVWPAEYYSGPSPVAVLPRGVTFGCGAASIVALILIFLGGAFMASGGLAQLIDFSLGMSMGEVRGMFTADVTAAQKAGLEKAIEQMRTGLREGNVSVAQIQPVLESIRKQASDGKLSPSEVEALAAAARKASAAKRPSNTPRKP